MSLFSYGITRKYPYRWFTPVAIVGGIVLAILFSALNFYSNAYNMVSIVTRDPGRVESDYWVGSGPGSLTRKIQPECEKTIIPVGSKIFTNQTAFSYQLTSVQNSPTLAYLSEPLGRRSCEVEQVFIDFQTNNGRLAAMMDRSAWGVTVNANVHCKSPSRQFHIFPMMSLVVQYDPISEIYTPGISGFIRGNAPTQGFLWAETLLLGFWTETVTAITHQTAQPSGASSDPVSPRFNLSSGYIVFRTPGLDIKDTSFFADGQYAFFDNSSRGYRGNFSSQTNKPYETLANGAPWPNIWSPANHLAKAMFSAISADLGQAYDVVDVNGNDTTADRSMITTPDRLHYWSENLAQIWDASPVSNKNDVIRDRDLQMARYNETKGQPIQFTRSTISTTYICRVPNRKSRVHLSIAILVADLVFLRVAWTAYNYIVSYLLKTRHPEANFCLGCIKCNRDNVAGSEEHAFIHTGEETGYHGRGIELGDLSGGREGQADQQSLQNLLTRSPVPHSL